jgi:hypothetical protein
MLDDRFTRVAAAAGLLTGLVLLLNAGRRATLLPDAAGLHAAAPLAEALGMLVLTGLYAHHARSGGRLALVGYVTSFVGLGGLLGAEFVINLVFPEVGAARTQALLHGPAGHEFTVAAMIYLLGSVLFGVTLWMGKLLPRTATVLYVAGSIVIALRGVLPNVTLVPGLLATAVGIGWLSVALAQRVGEAARATVAV